MFNTVQPVDELQLHRRLLTGDKIAPEEVATLFIERLQTHLHLTYPQIDDQIILDATVDALMDYIEHPQNYNPQKRGLWGYLKMAAEGDLRNLLAKEKRRAKQTKTISMENVALLDLAGNIDIESESIVRQEVQLKLLELQQQQTGVASNELDRQLLALLNAGERRTIEYAKVLGIRHLTKTEQARIVKQHKDRLKVQIKRHQSG